jgi:hypothetical protein
VCGVKLLEPTCLLCHVVHVVMHGVVLLVFWNCDCGMVLWHAFEVLPADLW